MSTEWHIIFHKIDYYSDYYHYSDSVIWMTIINSKCDNDNIILKYQNDVTLIIIWFKSGPHMERYATFGGVDGTEGPTCN